jgi:hypothetical protein
LCPCINILVNQDPYISSQNQMSSSNMGNMPMYQGTSQNPMINPNIQGSINIHPITPTSSQLHNQSGISPLQNISQQPTISNIPMNTNIPTNISTQQINPNQNLSGGMSQDSMHMNQNIRNFPPQGNFMFFGGHQQQQSQNSTGNPINSAMNNFSTMMNQIQNPQMNQFQPNFQQSNIQTQQSNFSPKSLGPDELVMFKVPSSATNSIYVDGKFEIFPPNNAKVSP